MIPRIIHQCHTKGWEALSEEEVNAISINKKITHLGTIDFIQLKI